MLHHVILKLKRLYDENALMFLCQKPQMFTSDGQAGPGGTPHMTRLKRLLSAAASGASNRE